MYLYRPENLFHWGKVTVPVPDHRAGSIRFFDVEIIVVVIVLVDNADTERSGVAKGAIVHPVHIEVGKDAFIPAGTQKNIDFF